MVKIKWGSIICLFVAVSLLSALSLAADNVLSPPPLETITGQLEILIADNFETNVSHRRYAIRIKQPDGSYHSHALSFASQPPESSLRSGDRISIQGRILENAIVADSIQRVSEASTEEIRTMTGINSLAPLTIGDRKAIVLIVNMNDAVNPYGIADLAAMMYTNTQSVKGLYEASSYQQLSFDSDVDGVGGPDVFGPFTIDHSASEDCTTDNRDYRNVINSWSEAADEAARDQLIDLTQYQHKIYFLPNAVNCGWAGMGTLRCGDDNCRVWAVKSSNGSDEGRLIAHELGHNLDWNHSSTDPDNDGKLDVEYGDRSGIMGFPHWAQANAPHRDQLDWFDAYPGALVSPDCSDTYELYALERDPGTESVGTQVLKIPNPDTGEYYYVSYRKRITDYPSRDEYADKINIHHYDDRGGNTFHITNLGRGEKFEDTDNGITVTAISAGGDTATVTVDLPNAMPSADFSVTHNHLEVQFNNTSNDADGGIDSYLWDFGDGNTSDELEPSHTYTAGDTYTVRLTVTDNCGETDSRTRNVQVVPNNAPLADFSSSANKLAVQFTDASTDSDGDIQSRQWDFGDGTTSDQTNTSHVYTAPGSYTVALTVSDDDGAQNTKSQDVTVVGNVPPTAGFSFTTDISFVQFSDLSTDSDGTVVSHQWDFGDSATSIEAAPGHTYATSGTYTVTLTITDNDGDTHSVSQSVSVAAPIIPAAIPDFAFNMIGLNVEFTDNSTGTVTSYEWDFGDGATSTEAAPSHTYVQSGTYTVGMKVTNAAGSNTVTKEVSVSSDTITPTAQSSGGGGGGGCFISALN